MNYYMQNGDDGENEGENDDEFVVEHGHSESYVHA